MYCIKDKIKNINLVVGCEIGCSYCYARNNCKRFRTIPDFNIPTFFDSKLRLLDNKKYSAYLLTGQSDLSGWKDEWIKRTFEKIEHNPKTQYIFLTKRPERLNIQAAPDNAWFGVTITTAKEKVRIKQLFENVKANHYHLTFEPLFEDVGKIDLENIDWIVVGTETGNRKGKSIAKREWVLNIVNQAKIKNIPVFMKEDLICTFNEDEFIQEMPKSFLGENV